MSRSFATSKRLVLAGITASVLSVGTSVAGRMGSIEVGQPFLDLTLPSAHDDAPLSIANFRGEKVVLHVFASW